MADNAGLSAVAWALTYLAHSSALCGAAWLADRRLLPPAAVAAREAMWKTALLAGLLTATLQTSGAFVPLAGTVVLHSPPAVAVTSGTVGSIPARPSNAARVTSLATPRAAAVAFLLLWAAAAIVSGVGRFAALVRLHRLLAGRRELRRGALRSALNALERQTAPATRVRLTCSRRVGVPVVVGRSEICVPLRALRELDDGEQQALLGHELAHVIRRDPDWMTVAMIVESVLVFQPLTRLVRRRLRELSELACDEWAASRTSGGLPLARCLVKVAGWNDPGVGAVWVSPFAARRGALTERVERLVETPGAHGVRRSIALACAVASAATVAAFVPSVVVSPAMGSMSGSMSGSVTLEARAQADAAPIDRPPAAAARDAGPVRRSRGSFDDHPAAAGRNRGDGPAEGHRPTDGPADAGESPASTPAERAREGLAASAESALERVSPIRDALARFSMPPIDAAPKTREREPLVREAGWERKARMWAAYERRNPSPMPGRPQR